MDNTIFRRKIYDEILEWKENRSDKYALLIEGATDIISDLCEYRESL